jgi:signal transduction histidine kinase
MLAKQTAGADALTGELAGYISSEVNRLNTIVTRFLDFSRPAQLHLRPEAITQLVDRALKNVRARWPDSKVQVEQHYADGLLPVPVDADLCEQAFTNLFLNAYEAMENGGGTLRVTIAPVSSDGREGVEIEVADTGPGIAPELAEQIFNPFYTTKKTGVGLGLSIVSKIIDDHRGWIRVASEPGRGASFRVFLPAQ